MTIKRIFAPVAAAALAFSLTACGDDESTTEEKPTQVEQTEDKKTDDEKDKEREKETDTNAGPSEADVRAGLVQMFNAAGIEGMTPELIDEVSTCIVDDIYDDLAPESRETLAAGRDIMQGEQDYDMLFNSSRDCTTQAVGQGQATGGGTEVTGDVTKEEVAAGIEQLFANSGIEGMTPEIVSQLSTCIADGLYDKVSPESLRTLASGQDVMQDSPDYQIVFDTSTQCTQQVSQ